MFELPDRGTSGESSSIAEAGARPAQGDRRRRGPAPVHSLAASPENPMTDPEAIAISSRSPTSPGQRAARAVRPRRADATRRVRTSRSPGKTLAMIFMKASTRTRVSFEVGTYQLGGHALFLSPRDVPARPRRADRRHGARAVALRGRHHDPHVRARGRRGAGAKFADVPVINGLTDLLHPCQILADLLTMRQHLGGYEGKKVAWIGDGNNMANSWINAAYRLGFELALACPGRVRAGRSPARARAKRGEGHAHARSERRRSKAPTS